MSANPNWWETFFNGLIVDFWRRVMPAEATRAEADFFEEQLDLRPAARVIDVPCGDGRLALELARRGYRVTGVDISGDFLAAAREAGASQGLSIDWRQSDMRDLPWQGEFDGAFCGGSSFGYLGDEGDQDFLKAVARALRPGARFIVDAVKAAEALLPQFRDRYEMEAGDIRFAAENRYVLETGWIENRYTLTRGEQNEVRLARHRIYTGREIVSMLERAGFTSVKFFGSLAGEPFRIGSTRLIAFAVRAVQGAESDAVSLGRYG